MSSPGLMGCWLASIISAPDERLAITCGKWSNRMPIPSLCRSGGLLATRSWTRDPWISWSANQRSERLKLIVQNRRFLLLRAKGESPNLASQSLAAALRALAEQWEERFGSRPLLAESFTDPKEITSCPLIIHSADWCHCLSLYPIAFKNNGMSLNSCSEKCLSLNCNWIMVRTRGRSRSKNVALSRN